MRPVKFLGYVPQLLASQHPPADPFASERGTLVKQPLSANMMKGGE